MEHFTRNCELCDQAFTTEWPTKLYCSRRHKERARELRKRTRSPRPISTRICKGCAKEFQTRAKNKLYCNESCQQWSREQMRSERDRAYINQKTPAFRRRIYFRSKGICGICNEPIDLRFIYPNPRSYSVDHIVPRSLGGLHNIDNLQATHLECNIKKSNKPIE